ncbi:hypothetical protein [Rhizobium sp. C4]|uniref:hypothetical protein n=1 Tax=Rhizobium sp. C4 TaxID=1349800 RepID=UPI001E60ECF9|nr:hypothetical protein [Rhizobium sp. C4]MCD2173925.1 hypothetical protein [Rhizobium sp. C4]
MNIAKPVSAGNPCPFLRALVSQGMINDEFQPIGRLSDTICAISRVSDGGKPLPFVLVALIALAANGLSPVQIWRNGRQGVHLSGLRGGPLDKRGAGSRVIGVDGTVNEAELERLAGFASPKTDSAGETEPGLDAAEITRFMETNWARAAGHRRAIDRKLMDGEWPVLLQVLGKQGAGGQYLAVADIRQFVVDRALPERIASRLKL